MGALKEADSFVLKGECVRVGVTDRLSEPEDDLDGRSELPESLQVRAVQWFMITNMTRRVAEAGVAGPDGSSRLLLLPLRGELRAVGRRAEGSVHRQRRAPSAEAIPPGE